MAYQTLEKLFHADNSPHRFDSQKRLLEQRLASESTFRTGIKLATGELFLAVPRDLSLLHEQVLRRERRVSALWNSLPPIARGALIRSLIMDEVVYSNEIEGVHSTRRQIEAALDEAERDSTRLANAAEREHAPFIEFAHLYLGLTDNPRLPCAIEDVRAIYDSVVRDSLDEKDRIGGSLFRTGPVVIETNRGKVVHEGVAPAQIEGMLTQWLELSQADDMPEAFSAILCHFLFGYIHPFYDGNGRTGRYLLALHLSRLLSQPTVLSLSRIIAENKAAYYKAFDTAERPLNHAEGTFFVLTLLDLIGHAQDDLIAELETKGSMLLQLEERISACEGLGRRTCDALFYAAQMDVFDAFRETSLDGLAKHLEVSKPTARKALRGLEERSYLVKVSARPPVYRLTDAARELLGLA